jgi:hypothetical protein
MTSLLVTVTLDHIRRGKRGKCGECPGALAIMEAAPTLFAAVAVNTHSIDLWFMSPKYRRIALTPQPLRAFVKLFDAGNSVEPFSFHLEF